mgnify:FL=1
MAKKKENTNEDLVSVSEIPSNEKVTIILLASSGQLKEDIEGVVGGELANILINKGFAKLKN